jgi:predicted protein tyrosine phosphatase
LVKREQVAYNEILFVWEKLQERKCIILHEKWIFWMNVIILYIESVKLACVNDLECSQIHDELRFRW